MPLIISAGICTNIYAQDKSNKELRGDKYTFNYSYSKAVESYKDSKSLTPSGQRSLAESYRNLDSNTLAEETYAALINNAAGVIPEDYFNYSMVLKDNGKYAEAGFSMDKFIGLAPNDIRAKDFAANRINLNRMLKDNRQYRVTAQRVNSPAVDFAPSYYKDKVIFTSSRTNKVLPKEDNWLKQPYLDMYISEVNDGQLKSPVVFDSKLNGKMHDGPASFSKDGSVIAFTRNHYKDKSKDKVVELQIYFSYYKDGEWTEPEPFILNNAQYSVGHPCLTANGNTLYFTSDMPGGLGGADIYRTTKDMNGVWAKPENLGNQVNTESDEMFPFYEENSKKLLFTSNGRYGLGGLDIFICDLTPQGFEKVYNPGYPINTRYDDFSAIVNDKMTQGYFSSNRIGGSGSDDIYAFEILPVDSGKKIDGIAKEKNGTIVPHTFITLSDENDNMLDTITTSVNGSYSFVAAANRNYKLRGRKDKFNDGTNVASTFGKEYIVKADVVLMKKQDPIRVAQKLKVKADLAVVLELNPIYFDLDKYNIRPDAEIELNKIVEVMNDYPEMVVELSSYTDCRASRGYNQVLSDKRAKSTTQYIKRRISKPSRISGNGYGESKLSNTCPCEDDVVSSCSDEEYQLQRNTEFIIVRQ